MGLLSDSLIKVQLSIPSKTTYSTHSYYMGPGGESPGPGTVECPSEMNGYSNDNYLGPIAYSGSVKCVGSYICKITGKGYYLSVFERTYQTEYLFADAINALIAAYPPEEYEIFTIEYGNIDAILEGDPSVYSGSLGQIPGITNITGEGGNFTYNTGPNTAKGSFKGSLDNMYNGGSSPGSIFIYSEKPSSSPAVECGGNESIKAAYGTYDNRVILPSPLIITVYLVNKQNKYELNYTLTPGSGTNPPYDNDSPDPEGENTPEGDGGYGAGDNGNNVVFVRDYDGGGITPLIDFDYVYIPNTIPVSDMDGIVIGTDIIAGHDAGYGLDSTNVYIKQITQSIKNADTMTFIEYVKYNEEGLFKIEDKVFGLIYGHTRFKGWIKSKQRIINESEQYIQYEAVGIKGWLQTLPFAALYKATTKSIKWLFEDISKYLPRQIVNERINITALPSSILPLFQIESASFAYALDSVIDYARKYQWYIDHTGTLKVLDMDNLPFINLTMPSEGETLSSLHRIISKNLNIDVSNCRTRCIIRGDAPIQEYDELKEVTWDMSASPLEFFGIGTITLNKRIQPNLLTNTSLPVYVYYIDGFSGITMPCPVSFVDCNTGVIKIAGLRQNSVYVRYCVRDDLNPLKYDTGWQGTAFTDYRVQQVLVQQDSRFKKILIPEGTVRDDSQYFSSYAENLLAPLRDWKIGGSVLLDDLATDVYIGISVKILNSGCSELTDKKLAITSLTWDFENKTTLLNLTNDYYLGSGIIDPLDDEKYDERKMIEKLILSKRKQEEAPWVFNT
jgi:hypothetical protein